MSNNNKNQTPYYVDKSDDETLGFLLECSNRGYNRGNQRPPSICKVSRILRDHSKSSYKPQLVSIGPIHRENKKLKKFESLKECYLDDLLYRCHDSEPKETLKAFLLKVNTSIPQIRESYAGMKKNYSDSELARMMVMDGCFILEFCFKHEEENSLPNKMQNTGIAMDLMLLENQVPFFVLQDLFDCSMGKVSFTLSNVLDKYLAPYVKLFRSRLPEKKSTTDVDHSDLPGKNSTTDVDHSDLPEKNSTTDVDHSDLPENFSTIDVDSDLPEKISTTDVVSDSTPAHVLGYMHKLYQLVAAKSSKAKHAEALKPVDEEQAAKSSNPVHAGILCCSVNFRKCPGSNCVLAPSQHAEASKPVDEELAAKSSNPTDAEEDEKRIEDTAFHSIVELDRSGMNFKPHQEDVWSMTIKFKSSHFACLPKATLLMPTLVIDDTTELILRNFIAYEQSFPHVRSYFTSYAYAMDMHIDTQEDIAKLVESKVLVNNLGSNQEAADMINKICKNISLTEFYYNQEFKQVDKYYNHFWPKHIARLRRVYFSNPWSIIALLAAIILFSLTVVQTIFTIRAA